ncbi:hypothetical protein [Bacteroides heparinolyticus]|uniref:hypothetical protein n=1 Tax=Prevotella heparinolytica TaxID=28113 RepID=UPI0035A1B3A5
MRFFLAIILSILCLVPMAAQVKVAGCYLRMVEPVKSETLKLVNDTIEVEFGFDNLNFFIDLGIKNLTGQPIEIDWDKTMLLSGESSYPIVFDDTILISKNSPRGKTTIPPKSKIYKKVSSDTNVEYNIPLFKKKSVKKYGAHKVGVYLYVNATGYRCVFEATLE